MTPMLEKIARAIGDVQLEGAPVGLVLTSDEIASVARAALLAMRDMTDQEVYNEYLEACSLGGDIIGGPETFRTEVWPKMIDAILKEGGE